MSFREKVAWVLLAAVLMGLAVYLYVVLGIASVSGWDAPVWAIVPGLIAMGLLTAILAAIGAAVTATRSREDAHAPADERDRSIARLAAARSYSMIVPGLAGIVTAMLLGATLFQVANLLVALFLASEAIRYASEAIAYRRGL